MISLEPYQQRSGTNYAERTATWRNLLETYYSVMFHLAHFMQVKYQGSLDIFKDSNYLDCIKTGQGTPNLKEIYLGINNLTGVFPAFISNASRLTVLDLSNNILSGSIPDSLGNLEFLEVLQIGLNKLIYQNPSSQLTFLTSLTRCRNLRELVIAPNPLNGILPVSIGNFSSSLQIFSAPRCKLRGIIPEEIGNLTNVLTISLFANDLTGFIPKTVKGLQKLQRILIQSNMISGTIPDEICHLQNIGDMSFKGKQNFRSVAIVFGESY
ncbi:hypothetical protein KY290_023084 [Solanum tuberosum]|uniref:Uncharacterized protein n=1 Tax=Solanum tuberosum TaxID=4113 RepID=A0ABQ7V857_SOLTU|nr:hypothetical protein KY284_022008 [Solanum tuberosum]KAH0684357.1 hypothetical protein KY289_022109 [Solanum tuberosum]KAH0694780.1 hypothetical protein KY285_021877 [Solanum tuberosum]KAH0759591.1 hypothetical protein KY290_023084 [Solanum tuberosum]